MAAPCVSLCDINLAIVFLKKLRQPTYLFHKHYRSPVTMATLRQTNQPSVTAGLDPLSPHYIMLIRPQESLPLARIYCQLFIFKYIFKI